MSSHIGVSSSGPTIPIRPGKSTAWWGMIGLMITEGMLFLLLLFTYFFFRAQEGPWPPADIPLPGLKSSGIRSAVLLLSTFPMIWAENALEERGDRVKSMVWQVIALGMGGIFLIGHIQEQFLLIDELSPLQTAYGSVYMTILNFHGTHLAVGMLILGYVLIHTARGYVTQRRPTMITMAGYYWHFVDAIWVFVYSSLYLSPHVLGN